MRCILLTNSLGRVSVAIVLHLFDIMYSNSLSKQFDVSLVDSRDQMSAFKARLSAAGLAVTELTDRVTE